MSALRAAARRHNLDKLARAVRGLGSAARTSFAPVGRLVASLTALTGLGGIGGVAAIFKGFGEGGDQVAKTADMLGLAIGQYQELLHASEKGGFAAEKFTQSMRTLNQRIGEAASGQNKELAALFRKMGISLKDSNGEIRSAGDLLPDLAEAFRVNEDAVLRTVIATKLFEAEGVGFINVLKGGREALKEQMAEARRNGLLTEEQARNAERQQDAILNLSRAWRGLTLLIGAKLSPVLQPMIKQLTQWLRTNRELIATRIDGFLQSVVSALTAFDWAGAIQSARSFASSIGRMVEFIGGWKVALSAVALVLSSGVIVNVLTMTAALGKLTIAILTTSTSLGALAFGPVIAAIGNFIVALRAGYGAMAAFNLVMAANPLGAFLVIASLVAGAAALIIANWSGLTSFFSGLWDGLVEAFEYGWSKIKPIADMLGKVMKFTPLGLVVTATQKLAEVALPPSADGGESGGGQAAQGQVAPSLAVQAAKQERQKVDVSGTTEVHVSFDGLPKGARVETKSKGPVATRTNVGHSMAAMRP